MSLETGDYINDLTITNPVSADPKSAGDDHLRLLKKVLKECLNGFSGGILLRATETGTAAVHVLTPTTALVAYVTGQMLLYSPVNAGTGALTVNVSALGAKSVKTIMGADPTSGDITANQPILLVYDGTNFVLLAGSEFLGKTGNQTMTGNLTLTGNFTPSGTVTLPATTSIGTVSATEILYLDGVTSAIQTQLNLLAPIASPTLTGVPAAPTATTGTSTTQLATTAFVAAAAFNVALPAQAGNNGKYVTTDGTNASWGTVTTPAAADPTGTIAGAAVNGSASTFMRSDAAPALSLTIAQLNTAVTDADLAILGANTFTAAQEFATGTAIASAATINLNTSTGNRVHITGTTTITAVTLTRGPRTVIFDGILTLTHHATNNNLPGAANITTAAGDRAIYESDGTTVYCVSYIKASGAAVVAASSAVNYPQLIKSANYTLVLADAGYQIFHPASDTASRTFTIPSNASVAYAIGTVLVFVNPKGAKDVTVSITTDTLIDVRGVTGPRTFAMNNILTALKITATRWMCYFADNDNPTVAQFLAIAHSTSPFVTAYPWSSSGFGTKFANPATLPTGIGNGAAFSPAGTELAIAHDITPYVTAYPWSSSGFGTKFADPATVPTGEGLGAAFSPAGTELAIGHMTSPYVTAYPWSSSGFGTKFANPATLPTGEGNGAAFSQS